MSEPGRRVIFVDGIPVQEHGQPPVVGGLSNFVRAIYCMQYRMATGATSYGEDHIPQWDGGDDAYGRHHRCVWPRLAQFFVEHHIDPAAYIRLQFSFRRGQTPPTPNSLTSARSIEQYRDFSKADVARQRDEWARQCVMFVSEIEITRLSYPNEPPDRLAALTLIGPGFRTASPLFKYCLAMRGSMADVAAVYKMDALMQYVFQRQQINEAIGADIPESLRAEADSLYARLCSQELL